MDLLNHNERRQVMKMIGDATTSLCNALEIIVKAKERVINGSVDTTAEYQLRDAIKQANQAARRVGA